MMNCTDYREYLKRFESGEADSSDLQKMRAHEQQCPKCAKMRQMAERVQGGLEHYQKETPPLPEDFHEKCFRQLQREKKAKPKSIRRYLAAAAAGIVIIMFLLSGKDTIQKLSSKRANAPVTMDFASESMSYAPEYEEYGDYAAEMSAMETSSYSGGTSRMTSAPIVDDTKKIIRTVSIDIRTAEFQKSLSLIQKMCADSGGWISYSSVVSKSGGMTATLTLRIPSQKLDAFLSGTGELGRIVRQDESSEDRTDSYKDTQNRLKTQKMLMERLQNLVTTSENLEDLLALEKQIAEIQYNIDSLNSSLLSTDQQVNYSKVDISLKEEVKKEVVETRELTFGERLSAAFELGFASFSESLQNMILVLAALLPYLAVIICILFILFMIVRRKKKKK